MAIADRERQVFGRAIEPGARLVAGVTVGVGAVGHAALLAAAAMLFYVLLTGL